MDQTTYYVTIAFMVCIGLFGVLAVGGSIYGILVWYPAYRKRKVDGLKAAGEQWRLARMLAEFGEFAQVRQDDRITSRNSFEESLEISRKLEDMRGIAYALIRLGDLLIEQNELIEAKACFSEGLVLAGELNDQESMAWGINDLGVIAMYEGKLEEAESLCSESLAMSLE